MRIRHEMGEVGLLGHKLIRGLLRHELVRHTSGRDRLIRHNIEGGGGGGGGGGRRRRKEVLLGGEKFND